LIVVSAFEAPTVVSDFDDVAVVGQAVEQRNRHLEIREDTRDLCWSSDMRFRFIEDRRADFPVTIMCDVLRVSPAGYYALRSRPLKHRNDLFRCMLLHCH
jgi:hypothetical protein